MPRLTAGETAPGIVVRAAVTAASVEARVSLLTSMESCAPGTVDPELISKFLELQRLSSWADPANGITPVSPKSLQKYLSRAVRGGYKAVRLRAEKLLDLSAPTSARQGDDVTPAAPNTVDTVDATLMVTSRYLDLLERLERLRVTSQEAESALRAHFRLFDDAKPRLRLVK